MVNRFAIAMVVAALLAPVLAGQTGGIQGTILDAKKKPIANGHVTANLAPASGAANPKGRNLHVVTDKLGSFAFFNLPVGVYRICVQVPGSALLDPCHWSAPVTAKVIAGQTTSSLRIGLEQGVQLNIRIDDTTQVLAKNEGKAQGANLSVGVWGGDNLFHPVPVSLKDNNGRFHMTYVPKGRLVRVAAFSKYFRLAERPTTAITAAGSGIQQVKFTVTGGGPK